MKKNSLANTNKHLRDPKKREEMIVRFAYGAGKHEGLKISLRETRKAYQALRNK